MRLTKRGLRTLSFKLKPPLGKRLNRGHPLSRGLEIAFIMTEGGIEKLYNHVNGNIVGIFHTVPRNPEGIYTNAGYVDCGATYGDRIENTDFSVFAIASVDSSLEDLDGIISKEVAVPYSFGLRYDNSTDGMVLYCDGADPSFFAKSLYIPSVGETFSVVGQFRKVTLPRLRIFINGLFKADSATANVTCTSNNDPLLIGSGYDGIRNWPGTIKCIYIYNRFLASSETASLHTNPYQMFEPVFNEVLFGYVAPVAGGEALEKSLSDTINMSDANTASFGLNKADTITLSDEIAKAFGRSFSDSMSLSDSISKSFELNKADAVSLSDSISKAVGLNKADTITLSDVITTLLTLLKSLSDTISMSDDIVKGINLNKSDTITLSDAIAKVTGLTLSDIISMSESYVLSGDAVRIFALYNFIASSMTFNFTAKPKTFNFIAKSKTFNFTAKNTVH